MPVTIDRIDITEGLVVFMAGNPPPAPNELPVMIHDTFHHWLVQNPGLTIRNTLPIVVGGNTVAIYVWFD
jgi:hypothetical protein